MEAEVQLSTFTAFVSAPTGAQQLAKVEEAQQEYDPRNDYYRPLREASVRAVVMKDIEPALRVARQSPEHKRENYLTCAAGLQQWMSTTEYEVVGRPTSRLWTSDGLGIHVNPEIALRIGDEISIAKLYFRQDEPTWDAKNVFSYLVKTAHRLDSGAEAVLLDVRRSRLHKGRPPRGIAKITRAQVAAFLSMWRSHKVA